MSLDVYLKTETPVVKPTGSGIFIRWQGANREISRATWDELNPGQEPITCTPSGSYSDVVYQRNITHNLGTMAEAAGIYNPLWRPDENGITHARQLIGPLSVGVTRLIANPDTFKIHNPDNGWGSYENLVDFVSGYLAACKRHPDARVEVCR